MITQEQFDRLPTVLREIVTYDRELESFARQCVVPLTPDTIERFRWVKFLRDEARAAAAVLWGYTARTKIGDSGAHA